MNSVVKLLVLFAALHAVRCGNINTGSCPIAPNCVACMSSRNSELERCLQLQLLISRTSNHPLETERYCQGNCPLILATASYYCGIDIDSLEPVFGGFCNTYDMDPTGVGDFDYTDDRSDTCYSGISSSGRCQLCTHGRSRDVLRCLQHHILLLNTNITRHRRTFCNGNCPLTLATSNLYCGVNTDPFAECDLNDNRQYCDDIMDDIPNDSDYINCTDSPSCDEPRCTSLISKYGCCLASSPDRSFFTRECNVMPCTVETGGSPAHLLTPLILVAATLFAALATF